MFCSKQQVILLCNSLKVKSELLICHISCTGTKLSASYPSQDSRFCLFILNKIIHLKKFSNLLCLFLYSGVCVCSVVSDSLQPHRLQPARLLCPWNFPGKNTGVGCHALLHGIFLTQGSNPRLLCLLHWQVDSLPLHCGLNFYGMCQMSLDTELSSICVFSNVLTPPRILWLHHLGNPTPLHV